MMASLNNLESSLNFWKFHLGQLLASNGSKREISGIRKLVHQLTRLLERKHRRSKFIPRECEEDFVPYDFDVKGRVTGFFDESPVSFGLIDPMSHKMINREKYKKKIAHRTRESECVSCSVPLPLCEWDETRTIRCKNCSKKGKWRCRKCHQRPCYEATQDCAACFDVKDFVTLHSNWAKIKRGKPVEHNDPTEDDLALLLENLGRELDEQWARHEHVEVDDDSIEYDVVVDGNESEESVEQRNRRRRRENNDSTADCYLRFDEWSQRWVMSIYDPEPEWSLQMDTESDARGDKKAAIAGKVCTNDCEVAQIRPIATPVRNEYKARPNNGVMFLMDANLKNPDMESMLEREYLVDSFTWSTTHPIQTQLYKCEPVLKFFAADLATNALREWFAYGRLDLVITLRVNQMKFHSGSMICCALPYYDGAHSNLETIPTVQHSTLYIGGDQTECRVHYPHSAYTRLLQWTVTGSQPSNVSPGVFIATVWNTLGTAASQPGTLTVSVWMKAVDSQLGAKIPKALNAIPQSDSIHSSAMNILTPMLSSLVKGGLNLVGDFDAPAVASGDVCDMMVTDHPVQVKSLRAKDSDTIDNDSLYFCMKAANLKNRLRKWSRVSVATLNTGGPVGGLITSIPLSPTAHGIAIVGNARTVTALFYYSTFFHMYRGGLEAKVELICNSFQKTQILLAYVPGRASTPTYAQAKSCPCVSLESGSINAVEFKAPYVSNTDFMPINLRQASFSAIGTLHLFVQNPLVVGDTVKASIEINIYLRAGTDFEFVGPRSYKEQKVQHDIDGVFQMDRSKGKSAPRLKTSEIYAQMGTFTPSELGTSYGEDEMIDEMDTDSGAQMTTDPTETADALALDMPVDANIFEPRGRQRKPNARFSHTDFRTLLRRPDFVGEHFIADVTSSNDFVRYGAGVPFAGDNHKAIAAPYAFWKGSNNIRVISNLTKNDPAILMGRLQPNVAGGVTMAVYGGPTPEDGVWKDAFCGITAMVANEAGAVVYSVPMYQQVPFSAVNRNTSIINAQKDFTTQLILYYQWPQTHEVVDRVLNVFHSIGDDFELYYPILFPVVNVLPLTSHHDIRRELNDTPKEGLGTTRMPHVRKRDGPGVSTLAPASGVLQMDEKPGSAREKQREHIPKPEKDKSGSGIIAAIMAAITAIKSFITGAAALVGVSNTVQRKWNKAKKMLELLAESALPILTGIHTFWTGGTGFKMVAVGQLLMTAINFVNKGSIQELQDLWFAQGEEDVELLVDAAMCAAPSGVRALWEKVRDQAKKIFAKVEEKARLVLTGILFFFNCVVYKMGCQFGPGITKYLLRKCGEPDSSLCYSMHVFFESLHYLLIGDGLNIEYERQQMTKLIDLCVDYQRRNSDNEFLADNMFKEYDNVVSYTRIKVMRDECATLAREFTTMSISPTFAQTIRDIYRTYQKAQEQFGNRSSQIEPVGIFLCGEPGSGKSLCASDLLSACIIRQMGWVKDGESPQREIYRAPMSDNNRFWDLYCRQKVVFFDEALQLRDGTGCMEFLTLISSAKNALNMADLSEKRMTFDSRVVVCASNADNVYASTQHMNTPEALVRRFPFTYKLEPTALYTTQGKFDYMKFTQAMEEENPRKVLDSAFSFRTHQLNSRSDFGPAVCFSEVVNGVCAELRSREAAYERLHKALVNLPASFQMDVERIVDADEEFHETAAAFDPFGPIFADTDESYVDPFIELGYYNCRDAPPAYSPTQFPPDEDSVETLLSTCNSPADYQEALTYLLDGRKHLVGNADGVRYQKSGYFRTAPSVLAKAEWNLGNVLNLYSKTPGVLYDWLDLKSSTPEFKLRIYKGLAWWLKRIGAIAATTVVVGLLATAAVVIMGAKSTLQSYVRSGNMAKTAAPKALVSAVSQYSSDIETRVMKNTRQLRIYEVARDTTFRVNSFWLDDHCFLTNKHAIDRIFVDGGSTVEIEVKDKDGVPTGAMPMTISKSCVTYFDKPELLDLVFVVVPSFQLAYIRALWPLISDDASWYETKSIEVKLVKGRDGDSDIRGRTCGYRRLVMNGSTYNMMEVTSSDVTSNGDCGRVYMVDGNVEKPLVGIHAALSSNGTLGFIPLNGKLLRDVRDKRTQVEHLRREEDKFEFQCSQTDNMYWNTHENALEKLGAVRLPWQNGNGSTRIAAFAIPQTKFARVHYKGRQFFHHEWDCDYEPAALRPSNGVHPLYTNAQKYEISGWATISEYYKDIISRYWKQVKIPIADFGIEDAVLSWDETINGTEVMQPIKQNTGCGYYSMFGYKDGKKDFFAEKRIDTYSSGETSPQKYDFSPIARTKIIDIYGMSFYDRLLEEEILIREGIVPLHFWTSTNKDELRPQRKVVACKTRVFEQPGLDFTLLMRKYMGRFLDWYKTHAGFWLYHGISKDKEAVWANYARGLAGHSLSGCAFDYSNYDGSVPQAAFFFFADLMDHFYERSDTPQTKRARRCLIDMLMNGMHIVGGEVFRTVKGNKSGNPMTDVFNSISNAFVMHWAFLVTRKTGGMSLDLGEFDANVRMLTYGDDVITTVKTHTLSYWNGKSVQDALKAIGMSVTSALKNEEIEEWMDFNDMTFLKSKFVYNPEYKIWLAPMPKADIYKELKYAPKECIGDESDLKLRCAVTQRFMAHHGENALFTYQRQLLDLGMPRVWGLLDYRAFAAEIRELQLSDSIYNG